MTRDPNAQYNLAAPESLPVRVAARVRRWMFRAFLKEFDPQPSDTVLDIGATSDRTYVHSNYFEAYYPFKSQIVAVGIDDASFLQTLYPGVRFVFANGLHLPFPSGAFDLVHSSAVLEHVGSSENQAHMISECLRVARHGIFLTTPNRWFPIEFHTQLPLLHWLPTPFYRAIYQAVGYGFFAKEGNLNLMTRMQLEQTAARFSGWRFKVGSARLLGLKSNLILIARPQSR